MRLQTAKTPGREDEMVEDAMQRGYGRVPGPEPPPALDRLAREVIGAAIAVHRTLGPGFQESVYEEALAVELTLRDIPFERQVVTSVPYEGRAVGEHRLDLLVAGKLVVELKTVATMSPVYEAVVLSYLKATGLQLALLINFKVPVLKDGIKRVVLSSPSLASSRLGGSNLNAHRGGQVNGD